jgi:5-(carboxyamino)imidazole ribonucleotide synthase
MGESVEMQRAAVLGNGQLAMMMWMAAESMDCVDVITVGSADSPAGHIDTDIYMGELNTPQDVQVFIDTCRPTVVTLEIDSTPLWLVKEFENRWVRVWPDSNALGLIHDKLIQKTHLLENGCPVPDFAQCDSLEQLYEFAKARSFKAIVKAREGGYDGNGNYMIRNEDDVQLAWNYFQRNGKSIPIMVEEMIQFDQEIAVMVGRNPNGEVIVYSVVETFQQDSMCQATIAPADISEALSIEAQQLAQSVVESFDGVGMFGVEMFVTKNNRLIVNEIAPRTHNSGHYTLGGSETSQFENALNAILNLPFGSPALIATTVVMINIISPADAIHKPDFSAIFGLDGVIGVDYSKQVRRGTPRKMGHMVYTSTSSDRKQVLEYASGLVAELNWYKQD